MRAAFCLPDTAVFDTFRTEWPERMSWGTEIDVVFAFFAPFLCIRPEGKEIKALKLRTAQLEVVFCCVLSVT